MPPHRSRRRIPEATVARLPVYLQILVDQAETGLDSISSDGDRRRADLHVRQARR